MANIINHHGNVEEVSDRELPIVLKLWAHDVPNSGMDTRGVPDEAADLIKELYEALEKARSGLESILPTGYPHPLMVEIDAALAKARGEQ